jgi:hypothetical protein
MEQERNRQELLTKNFKADRVRTALFLFEVFGVFFCRGRTLAVVFFNQKEEETVDMVFSQAKRCWTCRRC